MNRKEHRMREGTSLEYFLRICTEKSPERAKEIRTEIPKNWKEEGRRLERDLNNILSIGIESVYIIEAISGYERFINIPNGKYQGERRKARQPR